jgi:hypothetical protein
MISDFKAPTAKCAMMLPLAATPLIRKTGMMGINALIVLSIKDY